MATPTSSEEDLPVSSTKSNLDGVLVTEREHWLDGPPHELFARLRAPFFPWWVLAPGHDRRRNARALE